MTIDEMLSKIQANLVTKWDTRRMKIDADFAKRVAKCPDAEDFWFLRRLSVYVVDNG